MRHKWWGQRHLFWHKGFGFDGRGRVPYILFSNISVFSKKNQKHQLCNEETFSFLAQCPWVSLWDKLMKLEHDQIFQFPGLTVCCHMHQTMWDWISQPKLCREHSRKCHPKLQGLTGPNSLCGLRQVKRKRKKLIPHTGSRRWTGFCWGGAEEQQMQIAPSLLPLSGVLFHNQLSCENRKMWASKHRKQQHRKMSFCSFLRRYHSLQDLSLILR